MRRRLASTFVFDAVHTNGFLEGGPAAEAAILGREEQLGLAHGISRQLRGDVPAKDVDQDGWQRDATRSAMPSGWAMKGFRDPPHSGR
jgi:hypothetical protein